jgi:hypothetical protein
MGTAKYDCEENSEGVALFRIIRLNLLTTICYNMLLVSAIVLHAYLESLDPQKLKICIGCRHLHLALIQYIFVNKVSKHCGF